MRRGKAAQVAAASKEGEAPAASSTTNDNNNSTPHVVHPYENSIKTVAVVKTVEEFWKVYDYLKRPSELPTTTDYHFFRSHIKPTWEDESNEKGGKWIVRLPKGKYNIYIYTNNAFSKNDLVLRIFFYLRSCLRIITALFFF